MSHRRKMKSKLIRNVDKEEFQRETARLLEQFLQSDVDEQVAVGFGNFESKDNDTDSSDTVKEGLRAQDWGDRVKINGIWHLNNSGAVFFGNFHNKDHDIVSSDIIVKQGLRDGVERKGTGDTDDIPQGVLEGPRTELEQELVQELRRMADDIDRNRKLKTNVRLSLQEATGVLAYSSFASTVEQYFENIVGWERIAFVFRFTKNAIQTAGRGGLNAMRIKENCLRYVEDKCADWIVRHGGWASMLSGDSDDSMPELD